MNEDAIIREVLNPKNLTLPDVPTVIDIQFQRYTDSVGEPALRVIVVLDDETSDDARRWDHVEPIQEEIHRRLRDAGVERWPYFWFRTPSELKAAG